MLKQFARRILFPVITFFSIQKIFSLNSKRKHLNLCFHGVLTQPNKMLNKRHMPINEFEKIIQYISKNFEVYFSKDQKEKQNKKLSLSLSFDDGYFNNYQLALPILEKYKVPATFFVLSEPLKNSEFICWSDQLDLLLLDFPASEFKFNNLFFKNEKGKGFINEKGINIANYIKKLGDEKYPLLNKLCAEYEHFELNKIKNKEAISLLSPDELKKFSDSRFVDIGSHTCIHHNLADVEYEIAKRELSESKMEIENVIQKEIIEIAYPDGSYNEETKNIAEELGYKIQHAVTFNFDTDKKDNRIFNRLSISNSTTWQSNIIRIHRSF